MSIAAGPRNRYQHHAVVFDTDDAFVDAIVPFVVEGIDAGEPILLALTAHSLELLDPHCDLHDDLVHDLGDLYRNPVTTIDFLLRRYRDLADAGSDAYRSVGAVPHPGIGADWHRWARYEAVLNRALAHLPLWAVCTYDARLTPSHVIDDVERTHPYLTAPDRQGPNACFENETSFLSSLGPPAGIGDRRPPDRTLVDPTPVEAREMLEETLDAGGFGRQEIADLHVAVSELVSNAHRHGAGPVVVEYWTDPQRVEIAVRDRGNGPADPYAGWIPPADLLASGGGRGLWLTHQLAPELDLFTDDDRGFTARLSLTA